jgi:hypothetical protein
MRTLGEANRAKAIELASERLAFSRAAVELYDAVMEKLSDREGPYASVRGHLRVIREEKKAQEEFLEEKVRSLGGSVDQTPGSELLLRTEWTSIVAVLNDDEEPARLFESLLMAELYDSGGWEQLLALAEEACDAEAAGEFRQRLRQEEEHFLFVGRIVSRFARSATLEERAPILEEARP